MLLALGKRSRIGGQSFGQAVTLRGIEHHKAFEKRNRASLGVLALRVPLIVLWHEAVGIEHRLPPLALADAAARRERLPEGQPVLRRIAALDHRAPQDQGIDPRIGPSRNRVARQAGTGCRRTPRLNPRKHARLKLADDLGGHLIVKRSARLIRASGAARRHLALAASPVCPVHAHGVIILNKPNS